MIYIFPIILENENDTTPLNKTNKLHYAHASKAMLHIIEVSAQRLNLPSEWIYVIRVLIVL